MSLLFSYGLLFLFLSFLPLRGKEGTHTQRFLGRYDIFLGDCLYCISFGCLLFLGFSPSPRKEGSHIEEDFQQATATMKLKGISGTDLASDSGFGCPHRQGAVGSRKWHRLPGPLWSHPATFKKISHARRFRPLVRTSSPMRGYSELRHWWFSLGCLLF